jgi:hypothetical protein
MRVEGPLETIRAVGTEDPDYPLTAEQLEHRLTQLREHVSNGQISEARADIQQMAVRWPDSERVQHWARVLAPPEVVPTTGPDPRSQPRDRERAWLREHGLEYPGCWLAVYEDSLIAADPDLRAVRAEARQKLGHRTALLHYQPGEPRHR